ncbi:hypothetical protein CBS101457_001177 [Exobasidium rhododendri]|nr:hypothetical protein CBS101457_001177 [Exobasidium rhododendri]
MSAALFVNDTIGDIKSAKYGGPDKSQIPRFRRVGAGRVLGLDESLRIVQGSSSREIEITSGGRKRARYTDVEYLKKLGSRGQERLKSGTSNSNSIASFLPFESEKKPNDDNDSYLGHEFAGTNKSALSDNDDAHHSGDESASGAEASPQSEVLERLGALNAKILEDAQDITSWLSLSLIQEEVITSALAQDNSKAVEGGGGHGVGKSQRKLRQSISEVQLAVLERASRAHPSNALSVPLRIAKLHSAALSGMWDFERIKQEWVAGISTCLSNYEAAVEMLHAYLEWRISDGDSFVLHDILQIFADALEMFRHHYFHDTGSKTILEKEVESLRMIELLVQVMVDAGFPERANGLLQALSELTFRRPPRLSIKTEEDFKHSCAQLEEYWDLRDHRIGEKDSEGWASFYSGLDKRSEVTSKSKTSEVTMMTFAPVPKDLSDQDPIVRWLALEKARAALRRLPAKNEEEADWTTGELEVDCFSVVLFDDIGQFLVPIESERGKETLVSMFLSSLGVPGSGMLGSMGRNHRHLLRSEQFWPSHLLHPPHESNWAVIDGELMQRPRASALQDPFQVPIKTWFPRLGEMFSIQKDKAKPWFALWDSSEIEENGGKTAKLYLEQLNDFSTATALNRLGLSDSIQSHKATTKLAKQLLKGNQDDIDLWRAFARIERNNGAVETARTVYMSLLTGDGPALHLHFVWADWVEMKWETGDRVTTLHLLSLAATHGLGHAGQVSFQPLHSGTSISPMEILRSRRTFEQLLLQPTCSGSLVFCAALFQYLSGDAEEAFESASRVFTEYLQKEGVPPDDRQEAALTQCKFIWRHVKGRSATFIPQEITTLYSKYAIEFSDNSAFVALLAAFETRTKVENVVRKVLEGKMQRLGKEAREEDWLLYIYCELHLNLYSVNQNAVRALFERAVQARNTANSSLIWRLFVQFESHICRGKERRSNAALLHAKSILFRAIRQVPYCKDLYLAAFAPPLRSAFSTEELLSLAQTMQEKDLRFFANLSAFTETLEAEIIGDESDASLQPSR